MNKQPTTSVLGYRVLWIYILPRVGQLDNIVELFPDKISSKIRVGGWGFIGYLVDARRGGFVFVKGLRPGRSNAVKNRQSIWVTQIYSIGKRKQDNIKIDECGIWILGQFGREVNMIQIHNIKFKLLIKY